MNGRDTLFEDVLKHANIVNVISSYINVIKKGRNYTALCPFHDDRNPSLMISPDKQIFKCFVCGAGGNAITFVRDYEKITLGEALRKVALISGFSDPRLSEYRPERKTVADHLVPLYACLKDLTEYYQYSLTTVEGQIAQEYLASRKISADLQKKFRLGYAPLQGENTIRFLQGKGHSLKTMERVGISSGELENPTDRNRGRLIFPIADIDGRVIGFSARRLNEAEGAKYVNSPETPLFNKSAVLYNINQAKNSARRDGFLYILEGFMDVFALAEVGIDSAVALMGTFLTKEHLHILRPLNVELRIGLDGDQPGLMATMKIAMTLLESKSKFRLVIPDQEGRDPFDIFSDLGADGLKAYLNNLTSGIDFALAYYVKHLDLTKTTARESFVKSMLPLIAQESPLLAQDYLKKLAHYSGYSLRALNSELSRLQKAKTQAGRSFKVNEYHPERPLLRRLVRAEQALLLQMMQNKEAAKFYQEEVGNFVDDLHLYIAHFLIDYYQNHETLNVAELINDLELNCEHAKKELIKQRVVDLSFVPVPPYSQEHLEECKHVIADEKKKMLLEEERAASLSGKTDEERAKILKEFYQKHRES